MNNPHLTQVGVKTCGLIFLLCVLFSFLFNMVFAPKHIFTDYAEFWTQAKFSKEFPDINIYKPENQDRINNFATDILKPLTGPRDEEFTRPIIQSPFFLTLMSITMGSNYAFDRQLFQIACMAMALFAIVMMLLTLIHSKILSLLILIWIFGFFLPFWSDINNNNIDSIILGFLIFSVWLGSTKLWKGCFFSGCVFGLAIMVKPTITIIPVTSLYFSHYANGHRSKLWQEFFGLMLGITGAFVLSIIHFKDITIWYHWLVRIAALNLDYFPLNSYNLSLPSVFWHYLHLDVSMVTLLFFPTVTLGALWIHSKQQRDFVSSSRHDLPSDLQAIGLAGLAFLLGTPLAWVHYFMIALPMILILVARMFSGWPYERNMRWILNILTGLAICAVSIGPVYLLFPAIPPPGYFLPAWGGAFTLWLLGLLNLCRPIHIQNVR